MKKIVFFAFRGEMLCFNHLLLNAIDLVENGNDIKIVFEGEAVKLPELYQSKNNPLFKKAFELKIFDCICEACSEHMGAYSYNKGCGIPLKGDMKGHPSMNYYLEEGYEIITL